MKNFKPEVHNLRHRITNAEQRIGVLEDDLHPVQASISDLCKSQEATIDKLTDLVDCLRLHNLCFLGFLEGSERRNLESPTEHWLTNTFGATTCLTFFALERTHSPLTFL